jgi:hypothetical protein
MATSSMIVNRHNRIGITSLLMLEWHLPHVCISIGTLYRIQSPELKAPVSADETAAPPIPIL